MRILIEDYGYEVGIVEEILNGITCVRNSQNKISVKCIGYFYNSELKDCVFVLPKVLLRCSENDRQEMVFGHCLPEDIIHLEMAQNQLSKEELDFIYELAVWVYRAISVYRDCNENNRIVHKHYVSQMSRGRLCQCNTFLDILLALQKFNRENQQFFFSILRNLHSGFNKINWTKTVRSNHVIVQNNEAAYTRVINKKKMINFDEELLIIFFSIMNYIHEEYGFPVYIALGFDLIKGMKFRHYLNGMGCKRLRQIKYKYFNDKALYLWDLCYAFFEQSRIVNVSTNEQDYLFVSDFDIVFESIIDDLIGDAEFPEGLSKVQDDGKRIDHLFRYKDLFDNDSSQKIYYIGDSKYYKQRTPLGREAVYKQFTYARNLVQWNIDLFSDGREHDVVKLRDDVTEGYNVIPNFFISAYQEVLARDDSNILLVENNPYYKNMHFENRLFDRDSMLVAHYNINFLFVVALYARNNSLQKRAWKEKVREKFRKEIQKALSDSYDFYVINAREGVDAREYLNRNFRKLMGKIYSPFKNKNYYSVALSKDSKFENENNQLLKELRKQFEVRDYSIN